jgi:hypothetical protein
MRCLWVQASEPSRNPKTPAPFLGPWHSLDSLQVSCFPAPFVLGEGGGILAWSRGLGNGSSPVFSIGCAISIPNSVLLARALPLAQSSLPLHPPLQSLLSLHHFSEAGSIVPVCG